VALKNFDDVCLMLATSTMRNWKKRGAFSASIGSAGHTFTHLLRPGDPGAFTVGTPGLNGRYIDGTTEPGVIPYTNATSGKQKYICGIQHRGPGEEAAHVYYIADLIWINSGISVGLSTLQSFTPGAMQNRDRNGAALGHGVEAGLLVTADLSNSGTITDMAYDYTNQDGVQRTNVWVGRSIPQGLDTGNFIRFALYPGDTGVRSLDGIRMGASRREQCQLCCLELFIRRDSTTQGV
jgi:hypothetical protein